MQTAFISHKECWRDPASPSGYCTVGGFPHHVRGISGLFDATRLLVSVRPGPPPSGTTPITGRHLTVVPLPEPSGTGWRRKADMATWLPQHLPTLWREVRRADAVHAAVPGDVGTLGLLVALAQQKPLFVRHCGTWDEPASLVGRGLFWLLERIAGGRTVVMATGGGAAPPSPANPDISWIFSTSLTEARLDELPVADPWTPGDPLRLVMVGRLSRAKNAAAAIRALSAIREQHPGATLDLVGGGPMRSELDALAASLDLGNAVRMHGNVAHDEVLRILSQSHLFVFPTRTKEGFPKAVLEALACGLPVVATGVSVLPELIGTANGRVLETPTPESVAAAVLDLARDPEQLAEISRHARATSREYTLERWQDVIRERLEARWGPLRAASACL